MAYLASRLKLPTGLLLGSRRGLVVGAASNFLVKILWKLFGLINTILLAQLLGVEGLGTYVYALTVVGFITTFGTEGMRWLIVQKLAGYLGLGEWSLARGLQSRLRLIGLAIAVVLALLTGLGAWALVEPDNHGLGLTLMIAAILVPVVSQIYLTSSVLQGLGHVIMSQQPEWVIRPLVFLALLLIIYFAPQLDISPAVAMVAQVIAATVALVVGVLLLWPRVPAPMRTAAPAFETRDWLRAGVPFLVVGVLNKLNMQAGILFLGVIGGMEEVGIYRPAATVALIIMFGADAINLTIRPALARRYATGETEGFQRLGTYSAWAGFGVALLGTVVALVFGDLMLLVFGPEFRAGATALAILCVGRVVFAAMGQPGGFLEMTGRQSITMRGTLFAAGTNVVLSLALIPAFGVNGAAAATAGSLLILNIHNMRAVRRELSIDTSIFGLRPRAGATT